MFRQRLCKLICVVPQGEWRVGATRRLWREKRGERPVSKSVPESSYAATQHDHCERREPSRHSIHLKCMM